MSPLLFMVVVNGLLRRIQRGAPITFVRMYADYIAIVVQDAEVEMPQILRIFQALGEAAQLRLKIQKCVYIPLFLPSECDPSQLLTQTLPEYTDMKCDSKGAYLGFAVGPDKGHLAWDEALKKAAERVRLWQ